MMLRVRHVVLAWIVCAALQLVLFGVGGSVATRARIGDRATRVVAASPSVSFAKRYLVLEPNDHGAPVTAFAPEALLRLEPAGLGPSTAHHGPAGRLFHAAVACAIARAPPVLT